MRGMIKAFTFRRCGLVSLILGMEFVHTAIRPFGGTVARGIPRSIQRTEDLPCFESHLIFNLRCKGGSARFLDTESDEWSEGMDVLQRYSLAGRGNSSSENGSHHEQHAARSSKTDEHEIKKTSAVSVRSRNPTWMYNSFRARTKHMSFFPSMQPMSDKYVTSCTAGSRLHTAFAIF